MRCCVIVVNFSDVGSWREGGGRSVPSVPTTDEDRAPHTPPSARAAVSSEDEESAPPPLYHPQSQAAMMAHMMRPGMGPGPRMGSGAPMMYGPMMPPFVSDMSMLHVLSYHRHHCQIFLSGLSSECFDAVGCAAGRASGL